MGKLSENHRLEARDLRPLSYYPNILRRLRRMHATCRVRDDLFLLEDLCKNCPEPMSLTLQLGENQDDLFECLTNLEQILGRLRKLVVMIFIHPSPQDFGSINRVCQRCPELGLHLWVDGFVHGNLIHYPEMVDRLVSLGVETIMAENLSLLHDIIFRSHPKKLKLIVEEPFEELANYCLLLRQVVELRFPSPAYDEDLEWLDNICRMSPKLTKMRLNIVSGLQKLVNCEHILGRLKTMNARVDTGNHVQLCNEIFRRGRQLHEWTGSMPLGLVGYAMRACPVVAQIECLQEVQVATRVTVCDCRSDLEIVCEARFLFGLFEQVSGALLTLTKLTLVFTEVFDDSPSILDVIREIARQAPCLQSVEPKWNVPGHDPPMNLPTLLNQATMYG